MQKRPDTLVLLTPGFAKDESDTTCLTFLQDFVTAFTHLYPMVKLSIIAFQYPFKRGYYTWNGVRIYSAAGKSNRFPFRFITWIRVFNKLLVIQRHSTIIAVQSFWLTECALIGQWFRKLTGINHVSYAIGQDSKKENKYLKHLNFEQMKTVAMSETIVRNLYDATGYKAEKVIPIGIDTDKFSGGVLEKETDVLGVGSLTPLKNYDLFVEVVRELKNYFPEIKSMIAGEGPEKELLEEKVRKINLQSSVKLLGSIAHTEVIERMKKSRIFLHTSSSEGQSTVMMEALAAGLTVVCFDVGRYPDDTKVLVCHSKEEMVMKIRELLNGNDLNSEPLVLHKMDETVKTFAKIYDIC